MVDYLASVRTPTKHRNLASRALTDLRGIHPQEPDAQIPDGLSGDGVPVVDLLAGTSYPIPECAESHMSDTKTIPQLFNRLSHLPHTSLGGTTLGGTTILRVGQLGIPNGHVDWPSSL